MVVVVNKGIFGGGPYSTRGGKMLREVGKRNQCLAEIRVKRTKGGKRQGQAWVPSMTPPFMPGKITEEYHPGGNSVCYMIQTAHLMGLDPIYLLGFTLQSHSGYFFGRTNPVTRRTSFYTPERPISWLRWYESQYPGRVKLWYGWDGPIYEVFEKVEPGSEP